MEEVFCNLLLSSSWHKLFKSNGTKTSSYVFFSETNIMLYELEWAKWAGHLRRAFLENKKKIRTVALPR
jgi:hypothetical protein